MQNEKVYSFFFNVTFVCCWHMNIELKYKMNLVWVTNRGMWAFSLLVVRLGIWTFGSYTECMLSVRTRNAECGTFKKKVTLQRSSEIRSREWLTWMKPASAKKKCVCEEINFVFISCWNTVKSIGLGLLFPVGCVTWTHKEVIFFRLYVPVLRVHYYLDRCQLDLGI